jgi:hypothetical protein
VVDATVVRPDPVVAADFDRHLCPSRTLSAWSGVI